MTIFDISPTRISELNDADLRELVARLCEAQRERQGGSRIEVTWGGAQTAPDGGFDVVVSAVGPFTPTPVLSRPQVGLQVKRGGMGAGAITTEMRPNGDLRPFITEFAVTGGAYVIVSGADNCSEGMLRDRENAMRSAIQGVAASPNFTVAFVDRLRLARWVSVHPSVACWLRERLGLPILRGWRPHGRWSSTPLEAIDDLICEEGVSFRFQDDTATTEIPEAIDRVRAMVGTTSSIRIAGLSGVGKSRFVQALFEPGVGEAPLPPSQALYCDVGHGPNPTAIEMLEHLGALAAPCVLVLDNCPPEVHRQLTERLSQIGNPVRLVTVEYDVRDDRPSETQVVRMEAVGPEIVKRLIRRRHPEMSGLDASHLAELSLGNARLALALADAAPDTGSLSSFQDSQLFERLFWQRGLPDSSLHDAARALSLAYSFDFGGQEVPEELGFLGQFVGQDRLAMHRAAATLLQRGLTQARGRWRAVLPHALANRLAAEAIAALPTDLLADQFAAPEAGRLRQSFARRLSYLHQVPEVPEILNRWMRPHAPLDTTTDPGRCDLMLLETVGHLVPAVALRALAPVIAALDEESRDDRIDDISRILRSVAYSPDTFSEAVRCLSRLSLRPDGNRAAANALEGLFALYLSGTLAETQQRESVIRDYLGSGEAELGRLGVLLLGKSLETRWTGFSTVESARPAPYGWEPDGEQAAEWFQSFIRVATEFATTPGPIQAVVRRSFAKRVRGLWHFADLREAVENAAEAIHAASPWIEGWHAFREVLYFDGRRQNGDRDARARVEGLIRLLEPDEFIDQVRLALRAGWSFDVDFAENGEDIQAGQRAFEARLIDLGRALAGRPDVIAGLGRELFEDEGPSLNPLGRGLCEAADDPRNLWQTLLAIHLTNPAASKRLGVLSGFMCALDERDGELADALRDECLDIPDFSSDYPFFVRQGPMDEAGFARLLAALSLPSARVGWFSEFVWRDAYDLSDQKRMELLEGFLTFPNGTHAVIDALTMLQHVERDHRRAWPKALKEVFIRSAQREMSDPEVSDAMDHQLADLVRSSLDGGDAEHGNALLDTLLAIARGSYGHIFRVDQTAAAVAHQFPATFLSRTLEGGELDASYRRTFFRSSPSDGSVLDAIKGEDLMAWCRAGAVERWSMIALALQPFSQSSGETTLSETANALLLAAPNPVVFAEAFARAIYPNSWSGDLSVILGNRVAALAEVAVRSTDAVRAVLAPLLEEARGVMEREREVEQIEQRSREMRFE